MKKFFLIVFVFVAAGCIAQNTLADGGRSPGSKIFRSTEVDLKPQLKNGMIDLSAFIGNNFKFPDVKNKKIKIFASFVVELDGSMTDIKAFHIDISDIVQSDHVKIQTEEEKKIEESQAEAMKLETIRVLALFSEKWNPAKKDGKSVRCLFNYPINFNLE